MPSDVRTGAVVAFAAGLEGFGEAPAVVDAGGAVLSYGQLAAAADLLGARLGARRRLVAVAARPDRASLVAYLATLRAGHVALLVPADDHEVASRILAGHDPDCVLSPLEDEVAVDERRSGTAHDLHPDLALLLSTSGSTGSPKLVRLSHENLTANAEAIASYLGLRADDRAALTLPLHYCYGLSVVHSHLLVGASVLVGAGSVVDPCFWERFARHRATSFAAVPHTFDLLDRSGFADRALPSLRCVTQAGGRLAPDRVRHHAELGRRRGWDLVVMYGQTEATARMAYLPADLATVAPSAIGRPVPGGSLRVDEPDADGVGELVYQGPNVMLGYANRPEDLALGREVHELRTGDLGRRDEHGLFHVVGRRSRFAKLFGLRLDLDELERTLEPSGSVLCASDDEVLALGVEQPFDPALVADAVRARLGLPRSSVIAVGYPVLPRLTSGKPDRGALLAAALASPGGRRPAPIGPEEAAPAAPVGVRAIYEQVLGAGPVVDDDTFVGLGGDSLSYVEVSMLLEEQLGELPESWHLRSVAELESAVPARGALRAVETNVGLRAAAIGLVVGSHAGVLTLLGGAHLLLAVAGFNFARFHVSAASQPRQLRRGLTSIARIGLPVVAWITMMFAWREPFSIPRLLLVDNVAGEGLWRYWFVEVLLQLLVVFTVVLAVRPVREVERRSPFGFALVLLGTALVLRSGLSPLPDATEPMYRTDTAAWLFLGGWAAQRAVTGRQRVVVMGALLVGLPGFFDGTSRMLLVGAGLLALVWIPRLRVPPPVHRLLAVVAGASLWIFLTHFAVFPLLRAHVEPVVLFAVAFPIGIAAAAIMERSSTVIADWRRSALRRPAVPALRRTRSRVGQVSVGAGG